MFNSTEFFIAKRVHLHNLVQLFSGGKNATFAVERTDLY